ncbi:unnamed protein product [Diplocarpon coronariae]
MPITGRYKLLAVTGALTIFSPTRFFSPGGAAILSFSSRYKSSPEDLATKQLQISLKDINGRDRIIGRALSDIEYVRSLGGQLGQIVTQLHVNSLAFSHGEIILDKSHYKASENYPC